jgi:predicted anti-sigma-YlaC factor YlaD
MEQIPSKMKEEPNIMSCSAFQAQLPELIGTGTPLVFHPHIQNCDDCRALLADLENIAEAARKLLPFEEPPDELWKQIEAAIKKQNQYSDPA